MSPEKLKPTPSDTTESHAECPSPGKRLPHTPLAVEALVLMKGCRQQPQSSTPVKGPRCLLLRHFAIIFFESSSNAGVGNSECLERVMPVGHRKDTCRPVLQAKLRKRPASSLDLSVRREDQAHKARGRVSRGASGQTLQPMEDQLFFPSSQSKGRARRGEEGAQNQEGQGSIALDSVTCVRAMTH